MSNTNPLTPLALVVRLALNDADLSENTASIRSGIPRQTLRRRLVTGDFKYGELQQVADILGIKPSTLVALAEELAA